jgi:hypothetical protein
MLSDSYGHPSSLSLTPFRAQVLLGLPILTLKDGEVGQALMTFVVNPS